MSIIVEIGGFLGGVLNAYARKRRWSKLKTFIIVSHSFFVVGSFYVLLVPSAKSRFVGILIFAAAGIAVGLFSVMLMFVEKWCNDKKSGNHE